MKKYYPILILIFITSCTNSKTQSEKQEEQKEITRSDFQIILDSANVNGSILVYDLNENKYYSNDYEWAKTGRLPASTFKITNSIIGLETKVIENDSTIFKWNGEPRSYKSWEQDLSLKNAFHYSCVPCYQEVARAIGLKRMNDYLSRLEYGNMQVDSTNIDVFWLEGESEISQFEQIDFLKRFYRNELPISERTETIMKRMMVIAENEEHKLSGKTGWSVRNGNNNGWFVGYLETQNNTYFFATNIEPKEDFDMDKFPSARKEVTFRALDELRN
nr:class D beta-lactamase [uncultured Draconibacterium sp.]